jgi:hypothetical protein
MIPHDCNHPHSYEALGEVRTNEVKSHLNPVECPCAMSSIAYHSLSTWAIERVFEAEEHGIPSKNSRNECLDYPGVLGGIDQSLSQF